MYSNSEAILIILVTVIALVKGETRIFEIPEPRWRPGRIDIEILPRTDLKMTRRNSK